MAFKFTPSARSIRVTPWALSAALVLSWGCDSDSDSDAPGDHQHDTDGSVSAAVTGLTASAASTTVAVGETVALTATAEYDDGTTAAVDATWTLSDESLGSLANGVLTAAAAGTLTLTAEYEGQTATVDITLEAAGPTLERIAISAGLRMELNETITLRTTGYYDDETSADLEGVVWTSSDDAVVSVVGDQATSLAVGTVVLTATYGGFSETVEAEVGCNYPSFSGVLRYDDTMPSFSWANAYANGEAFNFSLADFHCNNQVWGDKEAVVLIIGAGWCSACTAYTLRLQPEIAALEEAGAVILFLEAQDSNYGNASSEFAESHLTRLIGPEGGVRVGDFDTQPQPNLVGSSEGIVAFPTVLVARRSDMKIIADGRMSDFYLPLMDIVTNVNADWSDPGAPVFNNRCNPFDEEASEPNDTTDTAAPLAVGTHTGGICNEEADYYQVDIEGEWSFSLEFSHATGDIDVYVWDVVEDQPLAINGDLIGSASGDDNESFTHSGPAIVRVFGYQGASAPYSVVLEEL